MNHKHMLFLAMSVALLTAPRSDGTAKELFINVGADNAPAEFGFGWGRPQTHKDHPFAWIRSHLEADVWIELDNAAAADFEMRAAAFYNPHRRQSLGLYVNDRFVSQWEFPHTVDLTVKVFRCTIPEGLLKAGRNRITFRVGYTGERGHAVAVDWIKLTLHP